MRSLRIPVLSVAGLGRRNEMVDGRQKQERLAEGEACPQCAEFLAHWAAGARARRVPVQVRLVEDQVGSRDPALQAVSEGMPGPDTVPDDSASASPHDPLAPLTDMVAIGIITALEAKALRAAFSLLRDGRRSSWRAVAKIAGCRHQVARKTALRALHLWHTTAGLTDRLETSTQPVVIRVRGSRQREVWTRETQQFGRRRVSRSKLVTDRRDREQVLKKHLPNEDRHYREYRASPMRELLDSLTLHLTAPAEGPAKGGAEKCGLLSPKDWAHNLRWAIRKIQRGTRAKKRPPPESFKDYLLVLAKGCPPCPNCRTPILVGCHLDGQRISRNRQFCDDSCKMQQERRRKGSAK